MHKGAENLHDPRRRPRAWQRRGNAARLVLVAAACVSFVAAAWLAFARAHAAGVRKGQQRPAGLDGQRAGGPDGAFRPRTLEADRIVLLDRQGRPRIQMEVGDEGPALTMLDENGKRRLELSLDRNGPAVQLLDANEEEQATVRLAGRRATVALGSRTPHGKAAVSLECESPGPSGLYFRDKAGETAVSLTRGAGTLGMLRFNDKKGHSCTKADGIFVADQKGRIRTQMALLNGNYPLVKVSDGTQRGPGSIQMDAHDNGVRRLSVYTQHGWPLFSIFANQARTTLSMGHPDDPRSLKISTGRDAAFAPAIHFRSEKKGGAVGSRLMLGLNKKSQPLMYMSDEDGKPVFRAPLSTRRGNGEGDP